MEQENGMGLGELLFRVYLALKRRIILVLAIILIFTAGGAIVANLRKPLYTATQMVSYKATSDDVNSTDMTSQYFQTVVGFCNKGCVVDRANFYYDVYANSTEFKNVKEFIEYVEAHANDKEDFSYYTVEKISAKKYIEQGRTSVSATSSTNDPVYVINIKYTDADRAAASDKVSILLCAAKLEVNSKNEKGNSKYFGVKITLENYGSLGIGSDWSKTRIVTVALVLGIIAALLAVYVINLSDRTVKEKKDIESITGVSLLAFIEDQEA